jgi:N-methylhydantoinase B
MKMPPFGMRGGAPGKMFRVLLERDGVESELDGKDNLVLRKGDLVTMLSGGGGGFGAPP